MTSKEIKDKRPTTNNNLSMPQKSNKKKIEKTKSAINIDLLSVRNTESVVIRFLSKSNEGLVLDILDSE